MSPDSSIPANFPLTNSYFQTITKKYSPNAQIKIKSSSLFMKFINVFVGVFNKSFMTDYITTIGTTIYVPDNFWNDTDFNSLNVIAHETVHIYDFKKNKLWFFITYLFPQILATISLMAILAIRNKWWLLSLVFLICLAPWPAPGRSKWELRGYTANMAIDQWVFGGFTDYPLLYISTLFSSFAYYRMNPNIIPDVLKVLTSIKNKSILSGPNNQPYTDLFEFLRENNLLK